MNKDLMPYLESLVKVIEKDIAKFAKKADEAMVLKPYAEWTERDKKRFFNRTTEQRLAESDKWVHKQVDAEHALKELKNIIFLHKMRLEAHDRA